MSPIPELQHNQPNLARALSSAAQINLFRQQAETSKTSNNLATEQLTEFKAGAPGRREAVANSLELGKLNLSKAKLDLLNRTIESMTNEVVSIGPEQYPEFVEKWSKIGTDMSKFPPADTFQKNPAAWRAFQRQTANNSQLVRDQIMLELKKEADIDVTKVRTSSAEKIAAEGQKGANYRSDSSIVANRNLAEFNQNAATERADNANIVSTNIAAGVQSGANERAKNSIVSSEKIAAESQAGANYRSDSSIIANRNLAEFNQEAATERADNANIVSTNIAKAREDAANERQRLQIQGKEPTSDYGFFLNILGRKPADAAEFKEFRKNIQINSGLTKPLLDLKKDYFRAIGSSNSAMRGVGQFVKDPNNMKVYEQEKARAKAIAEEFVRQGGSLKHLGIKEQSPGLEIGDKIRNNSTGATHTWTGKAWDPPLPPK